MNTILAWLAGSKAASAFTAGQDILNGKKTYLLAILGVVQALVNIVAAISGMSGLPAFIEFLRHATTNPDILILWGSLMAMTHRAAVDKAAIAAAGPVATAKDPGQP